MKAKKALFVGMFVVLVLAGFGAVEAGLAAFDYGNGPWLFERHPILRGSYVENVAFYNRYFDRSHWTKKEL